LVCSRDEPETLNSGAQGTRFFFGLRELAQGSKIRYTAGCLRWWKRKEEEKYLDQPVGEGWQGKASL